MKIRISIHCLSKFVFSCLPEPAGDFQQAGTLPYIRTRGAEDLGGDPCCASTVAASTRSAHDLDHRNLKAGPTARRIIIIGVVGEERNPLASALPARAGYSVPGNQRTTQQSITGIIRLCVSLSYCRSSQTPTMNAPKNKESQT